MKTRKSRSLRVLAMLFLLSLMAYQLVEANHDIPAWLTQIFNGPNYRIYYATSCPGGEPLCTPDEIVPLADGNGNGQPDAVDQMSGYLEDSRTAFMGTFGMREPYFNFTSPRLAYMSGGCWGSYNAHTMWMCARGTSADWVQAKSTAAHELFHGEQWAYSSAPQPTWVIEGQAAFVEDEIFNDLDDNAGTFLFSQGQAYLSNPNAFAITGTSYPAAWFWKYLAEKYGTTPDPSQGIDFVRRFWEKSETMHIAGIEAVNQTLADVSPGTTFEDVYKDFVIANYARKLTDPALPARYRFADESEPAPGPLSAVKLDVDQAVGPTDQVGPLTDGVSPWGVRYYQIRPTSSVPIISVDVHQDSSNRLFYTLLRIRGGGIISEERFTGRHFSRSFPNDSYDRVVLIVAGLENYANYRLGINATAPVLNIVDPIQARPAEVTAGSPAVRDTFLVKVEVLDATLQPVTGIDTSTFTMTVGTTLIPAADVLTSAYIQGQYWLLVRAPSKPVNIYNLEVQWSTLNDTELQAVNYTTRPTTDNILVLDRSGSMLGSKMTAAKNAGRLYIDSFPDADRISVVSFNEDALVNLNLDLLSVSRGPAVTAVNGLSAGGGTAIGDGAIGALNELINPTRTNTANRWAIILISDGMETDAQFIADFMAQYNARKDAAPPLKVPAVHTIALGADADRPKMQKLAQDTGGTFQYAAEPGIVLRPGDLAAPTINLPLDLAELYRVIAEAVDPQQQIYSHQAVWDKIHPIDESILVDSGAAEGVFTLNWPDGFSSGIAKLINPANVEVSSGRIDDATHAVWRVPSPMQGVWHLQVSIIQGQAETYLVEAALKSPLGIDLYIDPAPENRLRGLPVDLVVSLADHAPVTGATVNAAVTAPDGTVYNLPLYDDGLHRDGGENDGLYGNRFFHTSLDGSYIVRASASGLSNLGSPFVRHVQRAFDLAKSGQVDDTDQDGMPDVWENAFGTDPKVPDSQNDPDLDGLSNYDEYQFGTDPQDSDSDDGGESDGSEISHLKDPLNPGDDGINPPGEIDILPGNGLNVILFPSLPGVSFWQLYATTSPNLPYSLIDGQVPPTGVYTHSQLLNDTTFWYRMVPVNAKNERSGPTYPVSGTPKTDPIDPRGSVLINAGEQFSVSPLVSLSLQAEDDPPPHTPFDRIPRPAVQTGQRPEATIEMRVSNDPSFTGASWVSFSPTLSWDLASQGGPALVYIQFRDDAGNVSEVFSDYIFVNYLLRLPLIMKE